MDIGKLYFERIHAIENVRNFFNKNIKLTTMQIIIFKDFVWAKLLSEKKNKKCVCLVGDPFIEQIYYDFKNTKNNLLKKNLYFYKVFF